LRWGTIPNWKRFAAEAIPMTLQLRGTAVAVMLLLSGAILAFAQDDASQHIKGDCNAPKPFREVAQDETATIAELCAGADSEIREDRRVTAAGSASDRGKPASIRAVAGEQRSPAKGALLEDGVPK
jgi:hypothetical protein